MIIRNLLKLALFVCFLVPLVVVGSVQAAEKKDEWKDSKENFSRITRLNLEIKYDDKVAIDPITSTKLNELLERILLDDRTGNLRKANYLLMKGLVDSSSSWDAQLVVYIQQYGVSSYWQEESVVPVTNYETVYVNDTVYDRYGRACVVQRQVVKAVDSQQVVPAHWNNYSSAGVEIQMFGKDEKLIWHFVDLRDASEKKKPLEMMERILIKATEKLAETKK